jgi:quercetin dioxygenase-like cupin family protein
LNTGSGPQGQQGLSRRQVELPPGARSAGTAGPGGELWFVIAGAGRLKSASKGATPVNPGTGVWLPPGAGCQLHADGAGPLSLDIVSLPAGPAGRGAPAQQAAPLVSELAGCPVEVTGDRQFRVLFGPGRGCDAATQFVGEIPPGRAPEHTHPYDELVLVLAGEGVLHAGDGDRPLTPGTSLHLRPGQPHCLENTGSGTLRVLGVFHPGGSPAAKKIQSLCRDGDRVWPGGQLPPGARREARYRSASSPVVVASSAALSSRHRPVNRGNRMASPAWSLIWPQAAV